MVLADQSLKMLRMAKDRVIKHKGGIPENICFLHADATLLPFKENIFSTVLAENLLHCLDDTSVLLLELKNIVSNNGNMYFTTLVKAERLVDKYLEKLAESGKLVQRCLEDHKTIFNEKGVSADYQLIGNLLLIKTKCFK